MGKDKSMMEIEGELAYERSVALLERFCTETYISCREDQVPQYEDTKCIVDRYADIGPMGGIASALELHPDHALLVMAVDLIQMDIATIKHLVAHRDKQKDITCFRNTHDFFEPLCAIYEPSIKSKVRNVIQARSYSLQKLIRNSDCKTLSISDLSAWVNRNE